MTHQVRGAESIEYTYDDVGRVVNVDYGNGKTITYTYDETGNRTSRIMVSPECACHPADADCDKRINIDEAAAYAACWKRGCTWDVDPNPIPIEYVTRGGLLWRQVETYCCNFAEFAPLVWVQCGAATSEAALGQAEAGSGGNAMRRFDAEMYSSGRPRRVTISVKPGAGATVYAVEESVPSGWDIRHVSHGGIIDEANGKIRWGLFYDAQPRTLSYELTPTGNDRAVATFAGVLSVDGSSSTIERGGARLTPRGDVDLDGDVDLGDYLTFLACFTGPGVQADGGCARLDFDEDSDVDLADFVSFQEAFTGQR